MSEVVDLSSIEATGDGVAWSATSTGLNANLVVLSANAEIGDHRNDEVDVLIVVLYGALKLVIDGEERRVGPHGTTTVPRGALRRVKAGAVGARYLSIHQARGPLGIRPS